MQTFDNMALSRLLIIILLIPVFSFGQAPAGPPVHIPVADSTFLQTGKPVAGEIKADDVHYYRVSLQTGEFVRGSIEQQGITIRIRAFFPDSQKIRSFEGPSEGTRIFRFVAEIPGVYTLELKVSGTAGKGRYRLMIQEIQPIAERLKIVPDERYVSPRLMALQKDIEKGTDRAEEKFWQEVQQRGTPLAESFEQDDRYQLVTFLWKETFKIYNVVVSWPPFSLDHPDDYKMVHLPGSNIWYKTLRIPKGSRFLYQLSPNETLSRAANAQRYATAQCDPLNPVRQPNNPNLTKYETFSIAVLPGAPAQPWAVRQPGVPAGRIEKHSFKSTVMNNERNVAVYLPPDYAPGDKPYQLLILFDGATYQTGVPAPVILDNLIAAKKIAPVVAVLIEASNENVRGEEYSCNPAFAAFMAKELMPWVRQQYHVTTNPAQVTVGGLSAGGLAAAYVAMTNPEIYGNVLAQSGMFWWSPHRDDGEEDNWIARQFIDLPVLPLRFYIEAGVFEPDILHSSRQLRDILKAKGYKVHYREFNGGHDRFSWRGTLSDGLLSLLSPGE